VLDLFAGSGSLGIEAASRGASEVCFVDSSIKSINLIKENTAILKNPGFEFRIVKSDVPVFLKKIKNIIFDIIFVDPPYSISEQMMKEVFDLIKKSGICDSSTVIVYEYFFKRIVENEISKLKVRKKSHFGDKIVSYLAV